MDLLSALPEEVFNEVVSYLTAKDIRRALLVSKGWNQIIGQSSHCMEKLTVIYYQYINSKKDIDVLLKSDRKYQNFKINFYGCIKELGVEANIRAILKKYANSIVKLETSHDFQRICELPKLKELTFNKAGSLYWRYGNSSYFFSSGLIVNCLNINSLNMCRSSYLSAKDSKILQNALQNMRNLKELALNNVEILNEIRRDCKFRLEKFKFDYSLLKISDFLKPHQSTLKFLKVIELRPEDVQFIFTELPKLQTLQFSFGSSHRSKNEWKFPQNTTIKKIIVQNYSYGMNEQEISVNIFSKLINLQEIKISMIYPRFISAFDACRSLVLVKYECLNYLVTEDQKIYLNNSEKIKFIQAKFPY